jgi:hypothetical protein
MTTITFFAAALLSYNPAARAQSNTFAKCTEPPEQYVVHFFERLERMDFLNLNNDFYPTFFSSRFKQRSSPQAVLQTMNNTRERFGLRMVNAPFSKRTIGLPQVNRKIGQPDVEVTYLAVSGRGKILQRATIICEGGYWRADGFAYEPSK